MRSRVARGVQVFTRRVGFEGWLGVALLVIAAVLAVIGLR